MGGIMSHISGHVKNGTKRKIWNCYNNTKNGKEHDMNGEIIGCNNKQIGNDVLESSSFTVS